MYLLVPSCIFGKASKAIAGEAGNRVDGKLKQQSVWQ